MPLVISSILLPFFPIANIVKDCNWVFQRRERGLGSARNLSASMSLHVLVLLSTSRLLSIPLYYQSLLAKLNQNTEADPASELYSVLKPSPRKSSTNHSNLLFPRCKGQIPQMSAKIFILVVEFVRKSLTSTLYRYP